MEFNSYEDVCIAIAEVNASCYSKIKETTFLLETWEDKNFVKVMQELRDAFDHIHHILIHKPPYSAEAQADINSEFEKYKGHMHRLAIDLLSKVFEAQGKMLRQYLNENGKASTWDAISFSTAQLVSKCRDREAPGGFIGRYDKLVEILDIMDSLIKEHVIMPLGKAKP